MLDNNQWLGLGVIAGIAYLVDNDYRGGKEYGAESFEAEERWYLSDPCYAIPDDRWDEFIHLVFANPNYDMNESMNIEWEVDGEDYIVEVWDSPGGDGVWRFSVGEFGVDAGLLAVIPEKVAMEGGKPYGGEWFDKKPTLFTDNRNYIVEINGERNQGFHAESFDAEDDYVIVDRGNYKVRVHKKNLDRFNRSTMHKIHSDKNKEGLMYDEETMRWIPLDAESYHLSNTMDESQQEDTDNLKARASSPIIADYVQAMAEWGFNNQDHLLLWESMCLMIEADEKGEFEEHIEMLEDNWVGEADFEAELDAESFEAEVCPCGCAMKGCVCSSSCKGECLGAESFRGGL